jgi:GDP-mannose 6-dehydrogenase
MMNGQYMIVAVLGLGYVGCVTAACLAKLGHKVTGVDRDEYKVNNVLAGKAPFYEPGLEEMVKETVASGLLRATVSLEEGLADADVALICVGTPSEANGNLGLGQLQRVAEDIAEFLPGRSKKLVVTVRSTVFPGTCEEVVMKALGGDRICSVVSNPEFLREGTAMRDFMEPSLLVVGGPDPEAVETVADLYRDLPVKACLVTLRTAEMIKYACNCFHAVKIGFANEIGALCGKLDIPANEVMATLCEDTKLNVSSAYLKPGFAFGGSCLPKDLRALNYRASRLDLKLPLMENVLPSNERHLRRSIDAAMAVPATRIGIYGLAFKENTDDLRESPIVTLIEHLIGKGRELRVFDPHIQIDEIYGTNRNFVLNAIPHIGKLLDATLDAMLGQCDHLILAQKPTPDAAAKIMACGLPVLDVVSGQHG